MSSIATDKQITRKQLTDLQWYRFGLVCQKIRQLREDGKIGRAHEKATR